MIMSEDTEIRPPETNSELIGRIATRQDQHLRFLANASRSVERADAIKRFRSRTRTAAEIRDPRKAWVRLALIESAVDELFETLQVTESGQTGDPEDMPTGRRQLLGGERPAE